MSDPGSAIKDQGLTTPRELTDGTEEVQIARSRAHSSTSRPARCRVGRLPPMTRRGVIARQVSTGADGGFTLVSLLREIPKPRAPEPEYLNRTADRGPRIAAGPFPVCVRRTASRPSAPGTIRRSP